MRACSTFLASLSLLAFLPSAVQATVTDRLYTDEVFYCSDSRSVVVDSFDLSYIKANNSAVFSFSVAATQSNLNVNANIYIGAYGLDVVNQTINLCDFFFGALCPLPLLNFSGEQTPLLEILWLDSADPQEPEQCPFPTMSLAISLL